MASVLSVLAILAVIAAIGSASKVQRKRASQPSSTVPSKPATPAKSSDLPQPAEVKSEPSSSSTVPSPARDPMAEELAESILEMTPDLPLAASLLVSKVVNPPENELGVQLDRPNLSEDTPDAAPAHHGANLLAEIAELDAQPSDRIAHLSQFVEHPDSIMRVSAAYALGELAAQTQGSAKENIIALLVRLSQDVDPQVRVQAASALGSQQSAIES